MTPGIEAIIRQHSKSFTWASRLLPKTRRDDAVALYAWCRRADDAVDAARDPRASLARLQDELDAIFAARRLDDPVAIAFADMVWRHSIPRHYPQELLNGMAMDLQPAFYATFEDLSLYCYRAAGVVGLMMCHVLGVRDDLALRHAAHLGMAMQLTNICRDVPEDCMRGRLYLPWQSLGIKSETDARALVAASLPDTMLERVPAAVRALLAAAEAGYQSGRLGLRFLDGRSALAIDAALRMYRGIGQALHRQYDQPFAGRAHVSRARKWALLLQAFLHQPRRPTLKETPTCPTSVLYYTPALYPCPGG